MKGIVFSAALIGLGAVAVGAQPIAPPPAPIAVVQPFCPSAPAIAASYLRERVRSGKRLTMPRADAIDAIAKLTGPDGEFAGLKPCDAGYASAVHFYIDKVIKAVASKTEAGSSTT
jgi:hypothetical protein